VTSSAASTRVARKPLSIHPTAEREAERERRYYEREAGRGAEFIAAVRAALFRLEERPGSCALVDVVRHATVRSVRLKRFPFRVFFADLGDVLRVYAFAHDRRRPGYWKRRVRT
jgi:toxin ParE1/3/4